jgi:hypothetical protein
LSTVTYEYHMTLSDASSSTSVSSAEYTFPRTRVVSAVPTATVDCGRLWEEDAND